MLTIRENLLETIKKDGKPDRLVNCYTAFKPIGGDPVFQYVRGNRIRGTNSYDRWGTYISFPEDQPAAVPIVTPENAIIKDMEEWKESVKVPDLRANCSEGWETALKNKSAIDSSEYLSMTIMGGLGSIPGSIFGAIFFVILPEFLRWLGTFCGEWIVEWRQILYGLILVLMIMFKSDGILGGFDLRQIHLYNRLQKKNAAAEEGQKK